jgi:hypothetical protein
MRNEKLAVPVVTHARIEKRSGNPLRSSNYAAIFSVAIRTLPMRRVIDVSLGI